MVQDGKLPGPIEHLEFVQRQNTEVYRLSAGARRFIVHLTLQNVEYLRRICNNLHQLSGLEDDRIPRVAVWQANSDSPRTQGWAILIYDEIPGVELGPQNYTPAVWANLCDLLRRIHPIPQALEQPAGSFQTDKLTAFPVFAESLILRLRGLPLHLERVRRHLTAMAAYVRANHALFQVPPRLIHGDLNRSNLLVRPDGRAAVLDWFEMRAGDYAYDLAKLKFAMDSVAPHDSPELLRELAREYRDSFADPSLEQRLRFFLALTGLSYAFRYASQTALFGPARAWRVRTCYLHSEAQWRTPLQLDGRTPGAPAVRTEHWALKIPPVLRGLFYALTPKRVA
jgi:aminoglycoside phosphotransferase (APT) family kinase protein